MLVTVFMTAVESVAKELLELVYTQTSSKEHRAPNVYIEEQVINLNK